MKTAKVKNFLLLCSAFVASVVMLTVIQPPISFSALAWVSLVPFILACSPAAKPVPLALVAYLISLVYWLGNLYWIFPITWPGWLAFCLYTAVLWPILALCLRFCRAKKIPLFLAVPILFVGAERLQGLFLGGFFWRFLAHSQYANITLIQIADIFGAAALSFLIAMVNGLLAELIIAARSCHPEPIRFAQDKLREGSAFLPKAMRFFASLRMTSDRIAISWKNIFKISNLRIWAGMALVCAALVATVVYGRWRIKQSDKFVEAGPLVAALQSNISQSVKREAIRGEGEDSERISKAIFDELLQNSYASAEAGAELIVWPETMVQAILDADVWPFLASAENNKAFDKALREHSKEANFVLVGAYGGRIQQDSDLNISLARYNSAFLYRPDGQQDQKRYDKIHLVLFGEVLPFRKSSPLLFNLLMKFNPLGYDHSLDAGEEYTVFEMTSPVRNFTRGKNMIQKGKISNGAGGGGQEAQVYKFSVMICYEDTVPAIARRFALDKRGQKRLDWLVNISNDGWFVRFENGEVLPSTELAQHTAICVFRAVENRLAVLRSVNTGISCLIDTLGRVRDGFLAGTLPRRAMVRMGMAGWLLDRVPIDRRTTFFSKHGQWLDFCCAVGFALLIIVGSIRRKVKGAE